MSDSKIILTFKGNDGAYYTETVWASKFGENFIIDNIPFVAPHIALGDIVRAEVDGNDLYFDELVEESGHSTIQMVIFDPKNVYAIGKELEQLGCTWEGSHLKTLISIDVPKEINYAILKTYLESGLVAEKWTYKEACLSGVHRSTQ